MTYTSSPSTRWILNSTPSHSAGWRAADCKSFVSLHPITVDYQRERRVCSAGKGSESGWGLKDRYCPQFSAQHPGQANCRG
jgi:hypothetical protein